LGAYFILYEATLDITVTNLISNILIVE